MKKNRNMYRYWMIIPALAVFCVFFIVPTISGFVYSFSDWTIGKDQISFVGLKNYIKIFTNSELTGAIKNTFVYAIVVVIGKNLNGLLLALAVNTKIRFRGFIRVILFLPCVISTIIIGLVFVPVLHPNGILNSFLNSVGLGCLQKSWLVDRNIVMFSIAGVSIWQWSGYHMVIYLAGLQGISNEYGDIIEQVLYNIIPASVSENGKSFLYVNPLEIWPEACDKNPDRAHVKPTRQPWYGCACCPPNVVRFISSIGEYIYSVSEDILYIHQYMPGKAECETCHGIISVQQIGNYPWTNKVTISIESQNPIGQRVALRIPGWCKHYRITVDSAERQCLASHGYAFINCQTRKTDISIEFEMEPFFVYANPKVRCDNGKVALQKGPVVYCLEEVDNGNNLNLLRINTDVKPICRNDSTLPDGNQKLVCSGFRTLCNSEKLYSESKSPEQETEIFAVPYYYWGNRGYGEMQVWSRF